MRRYKYLIIFALLVASGFAAKFALAPDPFPKPGEYQVEVCLPAGSYKLKDLLVRVQSAVMSDPEWYVEYLKAHPEVGFGDVVPYHENLGLSQKEYDLMVIEMEKLRFEKAGTAVVKITEGPGGALKISFGDPRKQNHELTLSPDRRELGGRFGRVEDDDDKVASHSSRLLGKWRGRQWQIISGEMTLSPDAEWVQMDVGIGIDSEGRRLIFMRGGGRQDRQTYGGDFALRWPAN